ncbi:response regulator [Parvularcula maris]|uniref:Response regulator n=1 Tax=Parvularcula maris TaxID=2965077 RepID=A0A9X2LA54_9PROT|nr:response regulator [Parvularcula maris]MCQ8185877.1 response regulator [Parvularcula maris]
MDHNHTVMIVEDEALIGLDLARSLQKADYDVAGPFETSAEANKWLEQSAPVCALLDVNLGDGSNSFELAARLAASNIPFGFLTGYAASKGHIDQQFNDVPKLSKPCRPEEVVAMVRALSVRHS